MADERRSTGTYEHTNMKTAESDDVLSTVQADAILSESETQISGQGSGYHSIMLLDWLRRLVAYFTPRVLVLVDESTQRFMSSTSSAIWAPLSHQALSGYRFRVQVWLGISIMDSIRRPYDPSTQRRLLDW